MYSYLVMYHYVFKFFVNCVKFVILTSEASLEIPEVLSSILTGGNILLLDFFCYHVVKPLMLIFANFQCLRKTQFEWISLRDITYIDVRCLMCTGYIKLIYSSDKKEIYLSDFRWIDVRVWCWYFNGITIRMHEAIKQHIKINFKKRILKKGCIFPANDKIISILSLIYWPELQTMWNNECNWLVWVIWANWIFHRFHASNVILFCKFISNIVTNIFKDEWKMPQTVSLWFQLYTSNT